MGKFNLLRRGIRAVIQWQRSCKKKESQPIVTNIFLLSALALIIGLGAGFFSFMLGQPNALGKPCDS